MTRLDAKNFLDQAMQLFDRSNMTVAELVRKSGINRSTIYRLFTGQRRTVDRSTAHKIAQGLGADLEIRGDSVHLYVRDSSKMSGRITGDESFLKKDNLRVQRINQGILTMLKDVDVEVAEIVEDLVRWILKMDKEQVINLHKVHQMLLMDDNAELVQGRLEALATLMMPYETERRASSSAMLNV